MHKSLSRGLVIATVLASQITGAYGAVGSSTPDQSVASSRLVRVVAIQGSGVVHSADGSTFYPTGPVPAGTLLVIPDEDGTLPSGFSLSEVAANARTAPILAAGVECYGGTYMALINTWTSVQTASNCIHIGTSTGTATYWFGVAAGLPLAALGQGLGYYQGYNAQSGLARVIGESASGQRRRDLRELKSVVDAASQAVSMAAETARSDLARSQLESIARAMAGYARVVSEYLAAVPVATTASDSRTVEAFGRLIEFGAALNLACARSAEAV